MKSAKIIILLLFTTTNIFAFDKYIRIHENPNISYVKDGKLFDSEVIKDKLYLLNYIDPDERDVNKDTMDKIELLQPNIASLAILNMAATWLPDFLLEELIKENQKKHPATDFIYDYNKELVNKWNLKDDSFVVIVFDKDKNILFYKEGKLSNNEEKELIKILTSN